MHLLSPNIYRNTSEALESFDYITTHGIVRVEFASSFFLYMLIWCIDMEDMYGLVLNQMSYLGPFITSPPMYGYSRIWFFLFVLFICSFGIYILLEDVYGFLAIPVLGTFLRHYIIINI